jgi:hypothetical protein
MRNAEGFQRFVTLHDAAWLKNSEVMQPAGGHRGELLPPANNIWL